MVNFIYQNFFRIFDPNTERRLEIRIVIYFGIPLQPLPLQPLPLSMCDHNFHRITWYLLGYCQENMILFSTLG